MVGAGRADRCYSAIMRTPCKCFNRPGIPFRLPLAFSVFSGPVRWNAYSAGSRGICFTQSFFHGEKISFKPLATSSLDSAHGGGGRRGPCP